MRRAWSKRIGLDRYTTEAPEALQLPSGEFNPGDTIRVDLAADALTFTPVATAHASTPAA